LVFAILQDPGIGFRWKLDFVEIDFPGAVKRAFCRLEHNRQNERCKQQLFHDPPSLVCGAVFLRMPASWLGRPSDFVSVVLKIQKAARRLWLGHGPSTCRAGGIALFYCSRAGIPTFA
jgi:hypothetical protein